MKADKLSNAGRQLLDALTRVEYAGSPRSWKTGERDQAVLFEQAAAPPHDDRRRHLSLPQGVWRSPFDAVESPRLALTSRWKSLIPDPAPEYHDREVPRPLDPIT